MFSINTFSIVVLQTLVASVLAGQAIIHNQCDQDFIVLSTATNKQDNIGKGSTWSEPLNGLASLKIAADPSGFDTKRQRVTQFEYNVGSRLWYDISLINCVPFEGSQDASECPGHSGGITLSATGGDCVTASCPPGAYCPDQAYFKPKDDLATKSCQEGQNSGDITMTLCSGGAKAKKSIAGRLVFESALV